MTTQTTHTWTAHNNSFIFDSPYWLLTRKTTTCIHGRIEKKHKIVAKMRLKYVPETII